MKVFQILRIMTSESYGLISWNPEIRFGFHSIKFAYFLSNFFQ